MAAHTGGLTSAQLRILDCLIGCSHPDGVVALSQARIAIGAASTKIDKNLRKLIADGWLRVLRAADTKERTPTEYQLSIPAVTETLMVPSGPVPPAAPTLLDSWWERGWQHCRSGHDAFRRGQGTLNTAYPVLTLLTRSPTPRGVLASWLRTNERSVRDQAEKLVNSGVVTETDDGYALVGGNLTALLDNVAVEADLYRRRAGKEPITGTRVRQIAEYWRRIRQWECDSMEWSAEHGVPGTKTWRKEQAKDFAAYLNSPAGELLRHLWADTGRPSDEMIDEVVESHFRQIEESTASMAAWLARQED